MNAPPDVPLDAQASAFESASAEAPVAGPTPPRLHDYALSGNCWKVRLLLGMLGVEHRIVEVELFPAAEHRGEAFLAINPLGQLPVYVDGELTLTDSKAILVYLAARHDAGGAWWPVEDPERLARTVQWMAFGDAIGASAGRARLIEGFEAPGDAEPARREAYRLLEVLDAHLWFAEREGHDWLVPGAAPTLAELACAPYVLLSEEGGVMREGYPAVRRWCDRVVRLPGFEPMPGTFGA